jgi:hypothetical protein
MKEVREDLKIATIRSLPGLPEGIEAKQHIAELLDIEINSLKLFEGRSRQY